MSSPGKQARVRVVMCIGDSDTRMASSQVLSESGHFEIVGIASDLEELVGVCQLQYPDMLFVDEAVTGPDIEGALADARAGRPLPAVVLGKPDPPKRVKRRPNMRASATRQLRLDKQLLLDGGIAGRAQLQTRLLMLAAEVTTSKHTQTARSLQEAIKAVRTRVRHSGMRQDVVSLGTTPRDLILLIGGTGTDDVLDRLLPKITAARVPIAVAVRNLDPRLKLSLDAATKAQTQWLSESAMLRRSAGVLFVTTHANVTDEWLEVASGKPLEPAALVRSMATLGTAGLTVVLSDDETALVDGLPAVRDAGGQIAALDVTACPVPTAVEAAANAGLAEFTLGLDELGWILNASVPRKV